MRVAVAAQEQRLGEATLRATVGDRVGFRRVGLFHFGGGEIGGDVADGGAMVATPAAFAMTEVEAAILGAHFLEEAPVLRAVDAEEVAQARGAAVQELLLREDGRVQERIGKRQRAWQAGWVVIGVGAVVVAGQRVRQRRLH